MAWIYAVTPFIFYRDKSPENDMTLEIIQTCKTLKIFAELWKYLRHVKPLRFFQSFDRKLQDIIN